MIRSEKKIINLYQKHFLSARQIADTLLVSESKVRYVLQKHKIPKRNLSEAIRQVYITKFDKKIFKVKKNLTRKEEKLKVAGVMLYWGEGTKQGTTVTLSNSNPEMVALFLQFLRVICGISEDRLRVVLHYYSGQNKEYLMSFWSKKTKIPLSQFYEPFEHIHRRGTYKSMSEYGTISLRYSDSKLLELINSWILESSKILGRSSSVGRAALL